MKFDGFLSKEFERAIDFLKEKDFLKAKQVCDSLELRVSSKTQRRLLDALNHQIDLANKANVIPIFSNTDTVQKDNEYYVFFIVTPVFNGEDFIEETLESIANNSVNNRVYYHVQDGGSSDRTLEIVKKFIDNNKFENLMVTYSSEPDNGMYDAINSGFDFLFKCYEEIPNEHLIMSWLNADDVFEKYAFSTTVNFFSDNPSIQWITGHCNLIDANGNITALYETPKAYSRLNILLGKHDGGSFPFIQQEGTFWKADLWQAVKGLDSKYNLAGDWDLWRRFAQHSPLIKMHIVLAKHRRHDSQLSQDSQKYLDEVKKTTPFSEEGVLIEDQSYFALYDQNEKRWQVIDAFQSSDENRFVWPKISVVTPTYNQGDYIEETISSVLNQNYPNLEFIIIDGGSTDQTYKILERYKDRVDIIISEPDEGQSDAINKGFGYATGDIFTWLNSDDQFQENALFHVALEYTQTKSDLIIGICEVFENDKLIRRHLTANDNHFPLQDILDLDAGWNAGQFVYQPECFFSKSIWEKSGGYVRKDCFYSMDYELWSRFAIANANVSVIGTPLIKFRAHPEQKTADPSKFKAELKVVREEIISNNLLVPFESNRPKPKFSSKLKVAFVNDHGFKYGAGIAHQRMYASIDLAGHEVEAFDLKSSNLNIDVLIQAVSSYEPDLVICGNIHSAGVSDLELLKELDELAPVYWVTHDLWMLTGRCGYMSGCNAFLSGCNAACPTADEYPALPRNQIYQAWQNKLNVLKGLKQTTVLSNSRWAQDIFRKTFLQHNVKIPVERFVLGAPVDVFKPSDKSIDRLSLNVPEYKFVIALSVSSLSDDRKGGNFLIKALENLSEKRRLHLLLIGNPDQELPDLGVTITKTGYLESQAIIARAMNCADVYVGPSLEETFGQVFIEAALCGVPSISFKGSGTESAIIDGITGVLVEKGSVEGLVNAINEFRKNPVYLRNIAFSSRIAAKNNFSLEKMYHSIFNVIDRSGLLDKKQVPHQISFKEKSILSGKKNLQVDFIKGFSHVEGPCSDSPGLNHEFRWMHGNKSILSFFSSTERVVNVNLSFINILFDDQSLDLFVNGEHLMQSITIPRSNELFTLEIVNVNFKEGDNLIEILAHKVMDTNESEKRELSLIFQNYNLV